MLDMVGGDFAGSPLGAPRGVGTCTIAFQRGAKAEIVITDGMRRGLTLTDRRSAAPVAFKTIVADEILRRSAHVEGGG